MNAETEAPILWPPDVKSQLIRKDSDSGKDWRQEEKGMTEDAMIGWHQWFSGHEFQQALEDNEGQGSLACCSPWIHKESDMPQRLNSNNNPLKTSLTTKAHFFTKDDLTLTHQNHPQSIVALRIHSWFCTLYGFGGKHHDLCPSLQYHRKYFHCRIHCSFMS